MKEEFNKLMFYFGRSRCFGLYWDYEGFCSAAANTPTNANYGEARTGQEKDWLSSERAAQPIYGLSKKETPNITSSMQILLSFETLNSGGIKEYED
jgi:hypothetical protein